MIKGGWWKAGDERRVMNGGWWTVEVMNGAVMDGTLTEFLADLQTISNIYAKKHFAINSECNRPDAADLRFKRDDFFGSYSYIAHKYLALTIFLFYNSINYLLIWQQHWKNLRIKNTFWNLSYFISLKFKDRPDDAV